MIVLTAPVVLPMVTAQRIDPLWFGIYIVLVVEMAQITPPVGFNLYVLQNLTGRDIWTVTKASFPFFLLLCLGIVLIAAWPDIVLFLPRQMVSTSRPGRPASQCLRLERAFIRCRHPAQISAHVATAGRREIGSCRHSVGECSHVHTSQCPD